jgi:molecular chaperone GrpE (heat shock protein)
MTDSADLTGSALQRVCAELIALRERNDRQHKLFEQALTQARDDLQARFDRFAADAQAAYQRLREEFTGEKRYSLALLNALVDTMLDLDKLAGARPAADGAPSEVAAWAEGVAVATRKARAELARFGVHAFEATVGAPYAPALHERIGREKVEGMAADRVARQVEPGFASAAPDFVLRRAKVLVSE